MDIRSLPAWLKTFWTLAFAVILASLGGFATPTQAATQMTGSSSCTPAGGNPLNQCVGSHSWTASPGDTVSGTLDFKGGTPAYVMPGSSPGFSITSGMNPTPGGAIAYSWTIPAGASPGSYSVAVDTFYDPSTGCGEGGWCPSSSPGSVTVVVVSTPPPTAGNVSVTTPYQTQVHFTVPAGGSYSSMSATTPANAAQFDYVVPNVSYTPRAGFYGTDTFSYTVSGPGGSSSPYTGTITVTAPAPTVGNVSASTPYETGVTFAPNLGGGPATRLDVGLSGQGTPGVSGMNLTFSPNPGFSGVATFAYSATGPGGRSADATATVTVGAPPLPPAPGAGNVSASTPYETAVAIPLTPTGDYSSVQRVANPSSGSVSISGTTATYTPNGGFIGTDSFTYRAVGPGGNSPTRTVTVTVDAPMAPGAGNVTTSTAYETAKSIALTPSGVYSAVQKVADPSNGSVSISGTTATYTPNGGFIGTDSFTYRAVGPGGNSPTRTVTVTVDAPDVPVVAPVSVSTPYNTAVNVGLTGTGIITSFEVSGPLYGTVTLNGATATFTPDTDFSGLGAFKYRANGPGGSSLWRNVSVTVAAPAFVIYGDNLSTAYETDLQHTIRTNGLGTAQSVNVTTAPTHGTASVALVGGTGEITYAPAPGFYGADSLVVTATSAAGPVTATFNITVGLPAAPTASDTTLTTTFQTAKPVILPVAGVLTAVSVVDQPDHGSASITGTTLTYTPAAGYHGPDELTFVATGPGGSSATRTLSITVGLPAAPTIAGGSISTAYATPGATTLTTTGYQPVLAVATDPANGTVSVSGSSVTYTPAAGFYGPDAFTVTAANAGGTSSPATVSVAVGLPAAPTLPAASLTTAYETTGSVTLAPSGVYSSLAIVDQGDHGAATLAGDVLTYAPAAGFYGPDVVTVHAIGPGGTSATANVSVNVGLPGAPSVAAASLTTAYETTGSVTLAPSGVYSSLAIVDQGDHGTATLSGDVLTYTPAAGFYGPDVVTVHAIGPGGTSATASVAVTVAVPAAPTAQADSLATQFETAGSVTLAASGVVTDFSILAQPSHGALSLSGNVVTYTPAAGYYGPDAFTFTATGPGGVSAPAAVTVTVGLPSAPVAQPTTIATPFETSGVVNLSATGVHSSFQLANAATNGDVAIAGNVVTYTPAAGFYGADAFTYTATGPGGVSAPAAVTVTVGLPGKPVASPDSIKADYDTPAAITLRATGVFDTIDVVSQTAHGTLSLAGNVATYTPDAGYIGADAFTFTATGPGGTSNPATVAVTVEAPAAPVVQPATLTTPYETTGSVELKASGLLTRFELVTQPDHGAATLTGDVLTYTPDALHYGADSVTVQAVGPGGTSAPVAVAISVGPPGVPALQDATLSTAYETSGSVDLIATGIYSALEIVDGPANGTASIAGERLTYTPANGHFGADSVTVHAIGPGGNSAPALVSITVGVPAPSAADVSATTDMDVAVSFDLGAAHSDTAEAITTPSFGSVTITGTTATYTPDAGFFGSDSFKFSLTGAGGVSVTATATITVVGGPPPEAEPLEKEGPTGAPIVFDVTAGLEGGPFSAVRLVETASARQAQASSVVKAQSSQGGRAVVEGLKIVFYPDEGWTGRASFGFAVENRFGWSAPSTVTAIVTPIPETGPVIEAETWAGRPVDVNVTDQATWGPFEGVEIVGAIPADAVTVTVQRAGEGYALHLVPVGQFFGRVDIRYTLKNAYGVSNIGTVRLTVNERPDPSRDPEVTGLINAQTQAAYRFSGVQVGNVMRRLEAIHGNGPRRNNVGLTLVPMQDMDPFADNPIMERQRAYMVEAGMIEHVGGSAGEARQGASGQVAADKISWWMEGALDLGFKRQEAERGGFHFTTDGLTAGADLALSDKLIVGAGLGYGRDNSRVGSNGTRTSADAFSGFIYGSWQPRGQMFVDGVLGAMSMDYDARRFVTVTRQMIDSQREGRQLFGALAVGWEHRGQRLHWSPYGRVEFADIELGGFSEGDADPVFALAFDEQKSSRVVAALGVQGDYLFRFKTGDLSPTFRAEYRQEVKNGGTAGVRYADWEDSPNYRVQLAPYDDQNLVVGGGVRWEGVNNFAISADLEATAFNRTAQDARARISIQWKF